MLSGTLPRFAALLTILVAAAACASARFRPVSDVPGAIRMADVAVPEEVRALTLTIYPTPRMAEYGDALLPITRAVVVDDAHPQFAERIRDLSLEGGWTDLPREGYLLSVAGEGDHAVIVIAARDDAGRRWAEQALAAVTHEGPRGKFVRECRVLDAPLFALRGSKRPQAWETRYRANFAWGAKDDADTRGRMMTAVYAPQIPLDATGEGVARALEYFSPWQDRGVRLFALKFDDVSFALTPESELRHGRFATALVNFVKLVRQGLRRRDTDARLYLLPQTYWWNDPRLPAFAAGVLSAGGFAEDVGLVMTGPEIISETIDGRGLAAARRAFGLNETRALIYDNLGREGDWGPIDGRDAALANQASGVFGERGTPVNRLTRLDWLWNPKGYDPERSWRRAILELAGPKDFSRFEAVCRAFRSGAPHGDVANLVEAFAKAPDPAWKSPLPRTSLVALLRDDCARLAEPPAAAAATSR